MQGNLANIPGSAGTLGYLDAFPDTRTPRTGKIETNRIPANHAANDSAQPRRVRAAGMARRHQEQRLESQKNPNRRSRAFSEIVFGDARGG